LIGSSQSNTIHGLVVNAADQSPLPFVHLRFDRGDYGTISNIDGKFTVPDTIRQIELTYIGFKPLVLKTEIPHTDNWIIQLVPDNKMLSTIEVRPGKDKAYRIMQSVLDHIKDNNPENLESFQYTSYHKFWLSADAQADNKQSGKMKITAKELEKLQQRFESNHMLLIETLSQKKFLQPNHENEEILSSKVSGLKKESFFLLATQLQSFSIYRENFSLLSKKFLSPVSKTALRNYSFILEDTLSIERGDTTFLIRFHPARDRNFDGLKGFLHINTHGFAVQSVIAEPAISDKKEIFASIWQHYDRLESGEWFPSELNAAINFKMMTSFPMDSLSKKRKPLELSVTANSRTYLYQRVANTLHDPKVFPKYGVTIAAVKRDSLFDAKNFRYIPLTPKDSSTYQYLDSLGSKIRLNQKVKLLHYLSLGTIPIGVFSINYTYLFGYTINEGYKIGPGIETNRKLSKYFAAGAYMIYSTRDGIFRHGEWFRIYPTGYPDFTIQLGYRDMKKEFGQTELLEVYDIFEPEYFRSLLVQNMYHTKCYTASVEFRPVEPLNLKVFADKATNLDNAYGDVKMAGWAPFQLTRLGLQVRYSPGISFLNDTEMLMQSSPPKADLYLTVIQGIKELDSQFQFTKIEIKDKFHIRLSAMGTTTIMVRGGKIFNTAPPTEWFHGNGSYSGAFTILAPFSFATMRLNEFSADQYASLHIRHSFGTGYIPSSYWIRPELVLAQNMGVGSLQQRFTDATGASDFRKGFYESGIELNRILASSTVGLGFGTYYRYGAYKFSNNNLNFAYKFTLSFKF
jgi:hypothetical protein